MEDVYRAFWQISRQRGKGFSGPEKLTVGAILTFYDSFEPYPDKEDFYDLITAMDDKFIETVYKMTPKPPAP